MAVVAGAVGVLVIVLSLLSMVVTGLGFQLPAPLSPEQPWTSGLRVLVDLLAYAAVIAAGLALRWRPKMAVWPLGAAVLLAGAKVAYDYFIVGADIAVLRAMLTTDIALAALVAVAVFAHLVATDEEVARVELGPARTA